MDRMKVLVTGAAGFIGYHTSQRLLKEGNEVIGLDNLNDYYDVRLKESRLGQLESNSHFKFQKLDVSKKEEVDGFFKKNGPFDCVIHLAAQAGVRHSLKDPYAYVDSNVTGFLTILENIRHQKEKKAHLVYASTSSVFGLNQKMPFSVHEGANHPVSLYAATKKANEMMAHSYSHLFGIPTTGLRFFTVYGPWGRPDMALFLFTKNILEGKPIDVFNEGNHVRDFTYIDDIVDGIYRVSIHDAPRGNTSWDPENPDPSSSSAPFRVYNIGNHKQEKLMRYIEVIEKCLGKKADLNFLPMQPGDIRATEADIGDLKHDFGYSPKTEIDEGIENFIRWYREYYEFTL